MIVSTHHRPLLSLAGPLKGRKVTQGPGEETAGSPRQSSFTPTPAPVRKSVPPPPPLPPPPPPSLSQAFLPLKGPPLSPVTASRSLAVLPYTLHFHRTHIQAVTKLCQLSLPCIFQTLPPLPAPARPHSPPYIIKQLSNLLLLPFSLLFHPLQGSTGVST